MGEIGLSIMGLQRTDRYSFIYTNPKNPDEVWLKVTDLGLNQTQIGELGYEMDVWFIKWQYSITKIYSTHELRRKAFRYGEKILADDNLSKYRVEKIITRWGSNNGHSARCKCELCSAERARKEQEAIPKRRREAQEAQQAVERAITPDEFAKLILPPIQNESTSLANMLCNRTETINIFRRDDSVFNVDWGDYTPCGRQYD